MKPPGFQPPGFQVHHKFDRTFVSNAIAHKTKNPAVETQKSRLTAYLILTTFNIYATIARDISQLKLNYKCMEAVIESIVSKLRYLAKPQLEVVLNFVDFLNWQSGSGLSSKASDSDAEMGDREFEILLDEFADVFIKNKGVNVPRLSDFAVSRAGIYEDRP
ncbi:hypothetical protein [Tychonema sp. LEGE 06208]|uniref:hypothetical protein n=2 Tax=Oscillatoriales TaxID=1150 RepID=UPI0030DD6297